MDRFASSRLHLCVLFALTSSLGCADLESVPPLPGPEPSIHIEARANGAGATVIEACTVVESGFVCDGKSGSNGGLRASSGGESVDFWFETLYTDVGGAEHGSFKAELQGDEEGKEIVVTWDTSHVFKVTLPAPVAVTAPAKDAVILRGDAPITATYAPSGEADPMGWALSVQCPETSWTNEDVLATDTGEVVLNAADLAGELDAGGCPVSLTIKRKRRGTSESTREGTIDAIQSGEQSFTLAP